jgi:hypothetical protein
MIENLALSIMFTRPGGSHVLDAPRPAIFRDYARPVSYQLRSHNTVLSTSGSGHMGSVSIDGSISGDGEVYSAPPKGVVLKGKIRLEGRGPLASE